jgi:transposase-like protein
VWGVIDGHPGLRKAVGLVWPSVLVQRCCVHYADLQIMPMPPGHARREAGFALKGAA